MHALPILENGSASKTTIHHVMAGTLAIARPCATFGVKTGVVSSGHGWPAESVGSRYSMISIYSK